MIGSFPNLQPNRLAILDAESVGILIGISSDLLKLMLSPETPSKPFKIHLKFSIYLGLLSMKRQGIICILEDS